MLLATLAVYAPVASFEFVDYDDRFYVLENPQVQAGLTWTTVVWAATAHVVGHWHPLTMLSHALDWTLFGAWAGGHHLTSVVLHALNALLLFALLVRTTGAAGRAAIVAALFALHPLRVESVAWIAERKDVLSSTFFFATLHAYVGWVRRPSAARQALVLLAFAAGLMAKPMLVTLPVVALLLDRWPLARTTPLAARLREKIPLFALSLVSTLLTIAAARAHALSGLTDIPLGSRLTNAIVSLAWYLEKTVWPSNLAVLYVHPAVPGGLPVSAASLVAASAVLIAVSVGVWRASGAPYLATGWAWYLIMVLPVLGLVQAGIQARADRYTYLPLIGPYLMVVWGAGDLLARRAPGVGPRRLATVGAVLALLGCAVASRRQLMVWHDSESLYGHAIAVEPYNFMMHVNLGTVLEVAGRHDEAIAHFERSLAANPRYPLTHRALGGALEHTGRLDEALVHYREAVRLDPRDPGSLRLLGDALLAHGDAAAAVEQYRAALAVDVADAHTHNNLGNGLLAIGDEPGARAAYERAVALDPTLPGAQGNLAARLEASGDWSAALEHRRAHARLDPTSADAQQALAAALLHEGDDEQALGPLRTALHLDPTRADTRRLLAWVLATRSGGTPADAAEALALAEQSATGTSDAATLTTLAVAQAAAGRFADALATVTHARASAAAAGDGDLVRALDDMRERFRRQEPYRDAS